MREPSKTEPVLIITRGKKASGQLQLGVDNRTGRNIDMACAPAGEGLVRLTIGLVLPGKIDGEAWSWGATPSGATPSGARIALDDAGDIDLSDPQSSAMAEVVLALLGPFREHGDAAIEALGILQQCGVRRMLEAIDASVPKAGPT